MNKGKRDEVLYHSSVEVTEASTKASSFLDTLKSWENNQSLWRTLDVEGDGEWIQHGLVMDSLVVGHGGSYMPKVAQDICSCAAIIYCKINQRYATCTCVEKTLQAVAENYRTKILGGILAQLLVKAAAETMYASKIM